MTQAGYVHRVVIQDRSASMRSILEGAQEGLDGFIAEQAARSGKTTMSLWDFDEDIRCLYSMEPPAALAGYQIAPRYNTNLYDAVYMAVESEGRKLARLPEDQRPEDVVVLVNSDGEHNTTVAHDGPEVKALLAHQQDVYKWRVIYMGCNQDAFAEGARIGTRAGLTVNTVPSNDGMRSAWKMSSSYLDRVPVASAAAGRGVSIDLTDAERALGEGREDELARADAAAMSDDDLDEES